MTHRLKPRGHFGKDEASPVQLEWLSAIYGLARENGYPPTLRELADAMGVTSANGVTQMISRLKAKGFVSYKPPKSRTLIVTEAGLVQVNREPKR